MPDGDQRPRRVDRITRIGRQAEVALVQQREADVGDALFGAEQRHDLAVLVERHPETILIVGGDRRAKLDAAAVGGVLVVVRRAHAVDHGPDDVIGSRRVGVADAEADDVDAGRPFGRHLALDLGEQVGRQALDPPRETGPERLGHVEVLQELERAVAVVDLFGRAGHVHAPVGRDLDDQLAAGQLDRDRALAGAGAHQSDGGRGRAGAAGAGLPHAPLPDPDL